MILSIKKSDPILVQPNIKPSERFYFLSNLDQNFPIVVKTVYCFKPKDDRKSTQNAAGKGPENAGAIRQGLEKVLVHYYPLAGDLTISCDGKFIVDCSKLGVPFVDAVCDSEMDVLGDVSNVPCSPLLGQLIHTIYGARSILEMPLLSVQVTKFKCGGFVVGLAMNHLMADGIAAMEFINSWAETSRGISPSTSPFLDRSILASRNPPNVFQFPHNEYKEIEDISNMKLLYQNEQIVHKSFKFDLETLDRLKKRAMEDGNVKSCTTFTVLTALVWRARTEALGMKQTQETKLLLAVDARSKFKQPLPKGYFGNGVYITCCICNAGELMEKPLSFAIQNVQNAIKMVTEDYVKSGIDYFEATKARPRLDATLIVSTWTKLSFCTTDFGWGEPTQIGRVGLSSSLALFLSSGKEKGINVLIGLPTTAMKNFQELIQV